MTAARKRSPEGTQLDLEQRAKASRTAFDRLLRSEGETGSPYTCPAAKLGELLEQAWVNRDEVDAEMTAAADDALKLLADIVEQRIQGLEVAISYARATSPVGMLVQLAVAMDAVDLTKSAWTDADRASAQERAERCLYSVADALSRLTRTDREPSCVGRYMAVRTDPFRAAAEAIEHQASGAAPADTAVVPDTLRTTVEERLIELNERYEAFESVEHLIGQLDVPPGTAPAREDAHKLAETHLWRVQRSILREAIALPAASVLALALQARLIARVAHEWWDETSLSLDAEMCRHFIDNLLGTAGLSHIPMRDVTADELRGWVTDPETWPGGSRRNEGRAT